MKLLSALYRIQSKSGNETVMLNFLKQWIQANVSYANVEQDKKGNLYVIKGVSETYPVIVAHVDQVQTPTEIEVVQYRNLILGVNLATNSYAGLGADDKNGIWVALRCLLKFPNIKLAFFVSEEIGCIGSNAARMEFFKDARFVIQCDRKGAHDFITNASGTELCSKEFIEDAHLDNFGYKVTNGLMTDVRALKNKGLEVSCCNISCGYYSPHTEHETTNFVELKNCLNLVCYMIATMRKVYPHKKLKQKSFYGAGLGSDYGGPYINFDDPDTPKPTGKNWHMPETTKRTYKSRVTAYSQKLSETKEYGEQLTLVKSSLHTYLLDNKCLTPYNFFQENKSLFPLIPYTLIIKIFKEETEKC